MTLEQLSYFIKLSEVLHFTEAADELFVSQPTLSYAIKNLEKELEVPLFERGSKITLTQFGKIFLPYAQSACNILQEAKYKIDQTKQMPFGSVRLASSATCRATVSDYLSEFYADSDNKEVMIELVPTVSTSDAIDALLTGKVDLIFTPPIHKGVISYPVFRQELVIALPKDHKLCKHKTLSFSQIESEPFICGSEHGYVRRRLGDLFAYNKSTPRVVLSNVDFWIQLTYVSLGYGISLVPYSPLDTSINVEYRKLKHSEYCPYYLSHAEGSDLRPEVKFVLDHFLAIAEKSTE